MKRRRRPRVAVSALANLKAALTVAGDIRSDGSTPSVRPARSSACRAPSWDSWRWSSVQITGVAGAQSGKPRYNAAAASSTASC